MGRREEKVRCAAWWEGKFLWVRRKDGVCEDELLAADTTQS